MGRECQQVESRHHLRDISPESCKYQSPFQTHRPRHAPDFRLVLLFAVARFTRHKEADVPPLFPDDVGGNDQFFVPLPG